MIEKFESFRTAIVPIMVQRMLDKDREVRLCAYNKMTQWGFRLEDIREPANRMVILKESITDREPIGNRFVSNQDPLTIKDAALDFFLPSIVTRVEVELEPDAQSRIKQHLEESN